jgi:aldehyde dehydrogenase (NAD+)
VFTRDIDRGTRFALRVRAGTSGTGRPGGERAVREFSTEHGVSVPHEPRSYLV